ncbi:hypothetical protein CcaCcLH18_10123 [Colletotrichum camelliae]|nr:hypothetical protein CcaCcLH18_10123 [Colletotrichum camelliae]
MLVPVDMSLDNTRHSTAAGLRKVRDSTTFTAEFFILYKGILNADLVQREMGSGYYKIAKCCAEVCPEAIRNAVNALVPPEEPVVN